MQIFCCKVNFAFREKLVPITRQISTSIGPLVEVVVLKRVEGSPENGPFWELEAEQSQQVACEDAPSPKRDTSDVKEIKKGRPYHNKRHFLRNRKQSTHKKTTLLVMKYDIEWKFARNEGAPHGFANSECLNLIG